MDRAHERAHARAGAGGRADPTVLRLDPGVLASLTANALAAHEPERERRAGVRGAARQILERGTDRLAVDQWVSPLVERDVLRQQLGAQPVAIAADGIELQS